MEAFESELQSWLVERHLLAQMRREFGKAPQHFEFWPDADKSRVGAIFRAGIYEARLVIQAGEQATVRMY
jgi:hypothetical protein